MKKYEESNVTIALNVLYAEKEKTYPAYVSKHNSNCEKQVIPLLIPNEEKWHYLAVKKTIIIIRRNNSKQHGGFYCLNCLHSFATEKNLNHIKKSVKIKTFVM